MKLRINEKLVKKAVTFALVGTLATTALVGCGNKDVWDTQYTFNKIVVVNGDVATIVEVKKWKDYEGEQIQIETKDGLVFLVNSVNVYPMDVRNSDITAEDFARSIVGDDGEVNYLGSTQKTK